jgi:outer membrane protein
MVRLRSFGILVFVGFMTLAGQTAYAEKYAFLDVAKVFDEYQKTKDNDAKLQESGKEKEDARNKIVEEIRRMKDELELLNDAAKTEKQESINTKVRELQEFDTVARRELGEKRRVVVQEIFSDMDAVVQEYGKKNGYDFIINDKALLYKTDKFDVSADILKELNKRYKP